MRHFSLVLVVSLAAGSVGLTRAATSQSPSCAPIMDIYATSQAQLHACSLTEIPLTSISALPGGGSAYNYTLSDGQTYSMVQPPVGFNPQTASAGEDAAYGVPPAPSPQSAGYADWQKLADGHYAVVPQRPYLVVAQPLSQAQPSTASGSLSTNGNSIWAGHSNGGSGWTEVQVSYTEPTLGPTGCSNPQVGFWAGIGNTSNALGQTGTASGPYGLHQVFFENLPAGAAFPGVTAPKGSYVIDNVQYNGSDKWTYAVDISGTNHIFYGTGNYDGSIAEAITERPDGAPLMNFNQVHMYAQVGRSLDAMAPGTMWDMTGYATTSDISYGDFTVTQNHCGG